jgi:hypothetical protein
LLSIARQKSVGRRHALPAKLYRTKRDFRSPL